MDAYVYVQAEPGKSFDVAEGIAEMDVRQVAVVTGTWDVIVAVQDLDPMSLGQTIIGSIQERSGVIRTYTTPILETEATIFLRPNYPVRGIEKGVTALVQILVASGEGMNVLNALDAHEDVVGLAPVAADWDILAEVSAPSWEGVSETILTGLQSISGIEHTTTSLLVSAKLKLSDESA